MPRAAADPPAPHRLSRAILPIVAALIPLHVWLVWYVTRATGRPPDAGVPGAAIHAALPLGSDAKIAIGRGPSIAFSPDGRQIVYVAQAQGKVQLYRRALDSDTVVAISGSDGASSPFFSPDGRWIGFFAGDNLKKVPIDGGAAVTVTDAPSPRGESWTTDDTIVLTPRDNTGLWRVSAHGGRQEAVTSLAEGDASHRWPQVLPGGTHVMFTIWGGTWELARIAVQPMAGQGGGERRVLVKGAGFGRYVAGAGADRGYLVYAKPDGLLAAPFDLSRLEVTGEAVPIVDGVVMNFSGAAQFAANSSGVLAYLAAQPDPVERALTWVDRSGTASPAATLRGLGRWYDLSPDGSRLARYNIDGSTRDVWVEDLPRRTSTRVSFQRDAAAGPADRLNAVWSADGREIAFAAGAPLNLFRTSADGSGTQERLTTSANVQWPASWSPDARMLAFVEMDPLSSSDIWILALGEDGKPRGVQPFLRTPFNESAPMISPDGKWLAYQSNESGRYEVYVQPFPGGGQRIQVSKDNGVYPRWSPKGDELFFRSGANRIGMTVVPIAAESAFVPGPPRVLFELRGYESIFEVSPDASRFLMMPAVVRDAATTQINIIVNWTSAIANRQ